MMKTNRSGFSAVEVIVVVLLLAIVGFVGYVFVSRQNSQSAAPARIATDVPAAPQIKTKADLTKAEAILEGIDLEDTSDSSSLDNSLASF